MAFLDHRPLFPGHCLLVPRHHYETLSDLPPKLVGPFFSNVQLLARAVEVALDAEGTFVAMNNRVSQSVPHSTCSHCSASKKRWSERVFLAAQ